MAEGAKNLDTNPAANVDLVHVFEMVRHGARAPLIANEGVTFPVQEGMLTPQGMRQRYLLGRYNWMQFGKVFYSGDVEANLRNLSFAQSTLVYRTMQSGEAELNGFLHEYVKLKGRPYLSRPQWD